MEEKEHKRFTVSLPRDLYEEFELFRNKLNISRSDCIRKAMKSYMISEENITLPSSNVVGCITIVMAHEHFPTKAPPDDDRNVHDLDHDHVHDHDHVQDHDHVHDHVHEYDYSSKPIYANILQRDLILINDIQHHFSNIVLSTMHIHLEFEKCLEVIAVSGRYERVVALKNALKRLKSVLSIGFFVIDKE